MIAEASASKSAAPRQEHDSGEDDLDISNWFDDQLHTDFSSAEGGNLGADSDSNLPDTATMPSAVSKKDDAEEDEGEEDEDEEVANQKKESKQSSREWI